MNFSSPHSIRIQIMWENYRQQIVDHFPKPPGLPKHPDKYLEHVLEVYVQDAYHSLSIEGYRVSRELIEKVRNNSWQPDQHAVDRQENDALAARGYYEAFLAVKESVSKILQGESSSEVVLQDHSKWFQKLFAPSVRAGILSSADLFGYRRHQVYIRGSRHTPLAKEYLNEAMQTFFFLLEKEEHAGVRAVLGHFIFEYIHPYMDGNGRIGRFLMNAMMASGGYPWTIIEVTRREEYLRSLEAASVGSNIVPLTQFIASFIKNEN